jgi:cobalt/nickel transport system permease protein
VHVPDGFIDLPTSAAAGVVAVGAVAFAARRARAELADRTAPIAGLAAAFVFAAQMVNFQVLPGVSGHLLGGALAAVLVGPWTAVLCLAAVLGVQMLFADGGVTAWGVNVTNMGVVGVLAAWLTFRLVMLVLPRGRVGTSIGAGVAGAVSVLAAAASFLVWYAIGGTPDVPVDRIVAPLLGVHAVIGLGEAVITGLVVSAVVAARPDLVAGARYGRAPRAPEVPAERPVVAVPA